MAEDGAGKRPGKIRASLFNLFNEGNDDTTPGSPSPKRRQLNEKKEFKKYEFLKIFNEPVQLISAGETKRIRFNDAAIAELQKVDHDVNVVAVVGLYRTGKSLLLNRLAEADNAFEIGHTCNAKTMGIWIMCLPHPTQESQVLVLLDTEGIGAVLEDKLLEDRWYFLLSTLLSSTLVYNHNRILDQDAIQKLAFLKDIKSSLNIMASDTADDSYFDVFFPSFIMVMQNIGVELIDRVTNKPITADQYLEKALILKRGSSDSIREYNKPRELIRRYFKERRCFTFATPKYPKDLSKGTISKGKNIEFENDVKAFTNHIYRCKPKRMLSGKPLNGRMFGSLVRTYVGFVLEGKPPCIHTAVKEMIEYENQNLVLMAQDVYKSEMQRLVGATLPETEAMSQFHVQSTDKAIEYLRKVIIYDDVELFTGTAMEAFKQVLDSLIKAVTKDSERVCWGRVRYLDEQRLQKKIRLKAYQHISGYDEYIKDVEWIIKQFRKTIGLGPKKRQVLQSYLDGKEEEENMVFLMVQEAQKGKSVQEPKPHVEVIDRLSLRRLSKEGDRVSVSEFMSGIEEDQSKKRKELQDNLQNISNEKNKEYERQVREGFESASVTEQENKRFVEIFLPTERDEPEGAPDTLNDDKEKLSEYEPPWPSHLKTDYKAGSRAPGYAKVPETGDTSNAQENWYDDPTYYDFVDNPPRHQPSPREPPKPCTIL